MEPLNPGELIQNWRSPKVPKLSRQQICVRLPLILQAEIEALALFYADTGRTRTDIVADLLSHGVKSVLSVLLSERRLTADEWEHCEEQFGRQYDIGEVIGYRNPVDADRYLSCFRERRAALEADLLGESE